MDVRLSYKHCIFFTRLPTHQDIFQSRDKVCFCVIYLNHNDQVEWLSAGLEKAFQSHMNWDLSKHQERVTMTWSPQVHLSTHHQCAVFHWSYELCEFSASCNLCQPVISIFILLVILFIYLRILYKLDSLGTTVIPRTIMHSGGRGPGRSGGPEGRGW